MALDLLFEFVQRVGWGYVCPVKHKALDLLSEFIQRVGWGYVCPVKHKALDLLFEVIGRVGWLWICCLSLFRGWGGVMFVQSNTRL